MGTLYELTGQMAEIENLLEENGGEMTPELEEEWTETSESLTRKVDNYNTLITKLSDYSENVAKEIKRLQAIKKTYDNSVRRLKDHIADVMKANGIAKLEGNFCKMSLSSSTSTEVDEVTMLAPYYAKVGLLELKPWIFCELKVNKNILKETFKDKEVMPEGVKFVENKTLRIK